MLLTQLDMMLASQALDMFASQTRDLSHIELMFAKRTAIYRVRAQREHIESTKLTYRQKEKNKSKNRRIFSFYSCSFCLYKDLGLAHFAFVRTNAMLALFVECKFSDKNITPSWEPFFHLTASCLPQKAVLIIQYSIFNVCYSYSTFNIHFNRTRVRSHCCKE